VGGPLIASETAHVRAGMLVPFRVEIYAAETCARLSYDLPWPVGGEGISGSRA